MYITSGDYARDENEWGIHLGSVDYDAYVRDIQDSWRSLIGHDSRLSENDASGLVPLKCVSEWLDIGSQPTSWSEEGQIPYRLHTTANIPPSEFPYQFEGWAILNPGYACLGSFPSHIIAKTWLYLTSLSTQYLHDGAMDTYLNELYPSPSPMSRVLSSIRKPVLKADILRYSLLLRDGGIYTDMDTTSVRPFKEWGTTGVRDLVSNGSLLYLSEPLTLNLSFSPSTLEFIIQTNSSLQALPFYLGNSLTTENPPPGIIVSFEIPAHKTNWKSTGYVCGIQVVQWTMAAKSCHPIFIDVLARIVKKYEDAIKQRGTAEPANPDDIRHVLDWTGPGVFTDAVIRYMIARHGVYPRQVSSMTVPVRVGDLLILPAYSFNAWASDGPPNDQYTAVWHGAIGSWKPKERKKTSH